jgi:hypothetical protein
MSFEPESWHQAIKTLAAPFTDPNLEEPEQRRLLDFGIASMQWAYDVEPGHKDCPPLVMKIRSGLLTLDCDNHGTIVCRIKKGNKRAYYKSKGRNKK